MDSPPLQRITEHLIALAKKALAREGEFHPFAATLDQEGELQSFAVEEDTEDSDNRQDIEGLKDHLRLMADSSGIQAAGFVFDVILHRDGERQEAIQCSVEGIDGEAFEVFSPYTRVTSGAIEHKERFTVEREREIFGSGDFTLTLESEAPARAPTLRQIEAAVDRLSSRGGPGFLILEHAHGDYAQAAGGNGRFTAEWRVDSNGTIQHWVAGLGKAAKQEPAEIETNGCFVIVRSNEVLSAEDVRLILAAFAGGKERPETYLWRDMTATPAAGDVPGTTGVS